MTSHSNTFSRRDFLKTGALALPFILSGCVTHPTLPPSDDEFVKVRNRRFELHGKPYFFVGANMWYGCYLGDPAMAGGRDRFIRELPRLRALGVSNIRLLAGSEASALTASIPHAITRSPQVWDENLMKGLDFCLAEMAKHNMRAVLFLSNYWQWSGGFSQYVNWITNEKIPDPDQPVMAGGDWSGFMKFSARFYETPAAMELYKGFVAMLLNRRNTINGRIYRDDPTIMTWELANEPRPGADDADAAQVDIFAAWVDETARFIHQLAPRHLVCTGSEGVWGSLKKPDVYLKTHQTPAIDYVTVHMWVKNWGWLKDPQLSEEYQRAAVRARDHVEMHNVLATDKLGKPLVLEEFGLPRDHEQYLPGTPTTARDDYFHRMFNQVAKSCRDKRALQGANFWAWGGEGRDGHGAKDNSSVFLGDPFCEPQGLNSVFETDASTLAVIAEANKTLAGLG